MKGMIQLIVPVAFVVSSLTSVPLAQAQVRCEKIFAASAPFKAKKSWARQSFNHVLDSLQEFFVAIKDKTDDEKVAQILDSDIRKALFRVQSLTRILEPQEPVFFGQQRAYYENIENSVGALELAKSLRKTAKKLEDPELQVYFRAQEQQAKTAMIATLKSAGLWEKPEESIKNQKKIFKRYGDWQDGKKEREYLISILGGFAKDVHDAVKIQKYDNADIELGLHKLRRKLRWILMQASALQGLAKLTPEDGLNTKEQAWLDELTRVNPDVLTPKYMPAKAALVEKPLQIPLYKYAIISELVAKIGEMKDAAEIQIYFDQALTSTGASAERKTEITQKLAKLLESETVDHQALSRELQKRLTESKLLKHYVKDLEALN